MHATGKHAPFAFGVFETTPYDVLSLAHYNYCLKKDIQKGRNPMKRNIGLVAVVLVA